MKIIIYLTLFLALFGQAFPQSAPKAKKNKDAGTIFDEVYQAITKKPNWLFTEDACPFDVMAQKAVETTEELVPCSENAAACLNKCRNKDGSSCYWLAVLIQEKKGLMQPYSEFLFLRACRYGISSGCTNRAAGLLNTQADDEKSVTCAVNTFEKTCERNDPWGCTMFGYALMRGEGRAKNEEKALQVLEKSCNKYGDEDAACQEAKRLIELIKRTQTVY